MSFIIFTSVMVLAMLGILALLAREIVIFTRKRESYPVRRLTLRATTALMLLFLLASILIGIGAFHLLDPGSSPKPWIAFWGCIGLLTGAILCMVIADIRHLNEETNGEVKQLWHDIAEIIADHQAKPPQK
ncbi:MAG: hypothetical protein ACYDBB_25460 [Armatimonadota bacterium]